MGTHAELLYALRFGSPSSMSIQTPPRAVIIMGSLTHLVFFLLIGLAAGWLAGQITKGRSYGLVNDLIVGVVGAFLGGILFSLLGLSASNLIGSLITATVGAIVFLYLLRTIGKRY
ncbi:MAG: GlsB/YeaQ/YmgE family stress response membrane protein [Isosphaeraceae bacterium]